MPTNDMKIVKALNIAIIVLAALATLGSIAFVTLFAVSGSALSDPSLYSSIMYSLGGDYYGYHHSDMMGIDVMSSLIGLTIGLVVAVFVWCLICSAITLGAGILGLRNASKPDKLKGAFVWAIVGAVAAGLSGRMITMALLIVSTFFISKVRKSGTNASQPPYAQAAYGYTPQPAYDQAGYYGYTNQPAYQQPQSQQAVYTQPAYDQQPYAQPAPAYAPVVDQQFYAPATAGQPGQPEQPEQPLQAEPAQPAEESENKGQ